MMSGSSMLRTSLPVLAGRSFTLSSVGDSAAPMAAAMCSQTREAARCMRVASSRRRQSGTEARRSRRSRIRSGEEPCSSTTRARAPRRGVAGVDCCFSVMAAQAWKAGSTVPNTDESRRRKHSRKAISTNAATRQKRMATGGAACWTVCGHQTRRPGASKYRRRRVRFQCRSDDTMLSGCRK